MASNRHVRLRALQEKYSDPLVTLVTIMLLLLLFVVAPLQAAGAPVFQAFAGVVALAMVASVLVISASLVAAALMLIAFSLNLLVIFARLYHHPFSFDLHLVAVCWLALALTLGTVVIRIVFGAGQVNHHRVIGAVLLYLLIAIAFVSLFMLVDLSVSNAFKGFVLEDSPAIASTLIYFSFVTLTSTGYGEIVPVHPVARSLCNVESIIGQLYPATLLARLVTLELEGRRGS